ncbi:amino acid deaminase [Neptunicella marina]|uniref:Amino acid deaminase n=1 Tax=Neptunicella marina TaxID=2125989 RepID=A0A8J6M1P3_9ALTE|nr:amino acid deaminase [Neptunicella marina]MBC3765607.1 amino acid deaminase [Neptunicella marina]
MSIKLNAEIKNACNHKGMGDAVKLSGSGWKLLQEDISLPVAVIKQNALTTNLSWMNQFAQKAGVRLAPHGKTTMAPALFKAQIESGSWAMSLATAPQVSAAFHAGINRILMANQLVGKRNCQLIADSIKRGLEYYCFVDSPELAIQLNQFFEPQSSQLNVLIEIGVPGGRCGVRDVAQAEQLQALIATLPALKLCGIGFYEGVIKADNTPQAIADFVQQVREMTVRWFEKGYFASDEVLLTGAGSAWYDIVAEHLVPQSLPTAIKVVLRPGCYLIHDTGIYQQAQQDLVKRSVLACELDSELTSSLELWTYVQSIPEPGLAIVGMGKRDVAFDAGLPTAQLHYRPGDDAPKIVSGDWSLKKIMDQHAMLQLPSAADLKVGDMVVFSTSHPCLTFDKWRHIAVRDEDYVVSGLVETFF